MCKAIENPENVCFKCLKETEVTKISIPELGYGSRFDGFSSRINLCKECMETSNPRWWKLGTIISDADGLESYRYEKKIQEFIDTFPIEGKELFENRFGTNHFYNNPKMLSDLSYHMDPQDWIDYHLDKLPHEKCKEYGLYSFEEKKAYLERFPVCEQVCIIIFKDGSRMAHCCEKADGTAIGDKIKLNKYDMSDRCYQCKSFWERK